MKRTLLLLGCWAATCLPVTAFAVDFDLQAREAGPGHRMTSYWWKFVGKHWELTPPEKYTLTGGGELHLQRTDHPELAAVCRPSTGAERGMFLKKDQSAQDIYFRTLVPQGTKNLKLVSQQDNPLPFYGLNNVEAVYTYELGGIPYRATFLVNRAVEQPEKTPPQGQTAALPTKPVEDYFTTVVVAPQDSQPALFEAFQQLIATARISAKEPANEQSAQYVSHGML